jgi:tripeptide aminopeptidase
MEVPGMNAERLLERFLRYVQIDTTAGSPDQGYPSSPGQWELGKLLVEELTAAGLDDIRQDEWGLVWATLPANSRTAAPTIAFNAHLDTSPETTGLGVRPQVIRNYPGGDIVLPGDPKRVIRVADNAELNTLVGKTLITSDGTTLLGADDKAGLAVIVEAVAHLREHPELEHGPIRVLFTCDEEIGHGADHVDIADVGAVVCYTLDGFAADQIDFETFSADLATVTVHGVNIHPSVGKGRMVNALRGLGDYLSALPRDRLSPETTSDRQGFIHPYLMEGGVAQATAKILLRDFDESQLEAQRALLRELADQVAAALPGLEIDVKIAPQYRNMRAGLEREPRAVELVEQAMTRLGRSPKLTIIRGGTDGSLLTAKGLPTPNLSTGEHNPHSPLEWTCLEEMVQAAELVVELAQVWGAEPK